MPSVKLQNNPGKFAFNSNGADAISIKSHKYQKETVQKCYGPNWAKRAENSSRRLEIISIRAREKRIAFAVINIQGQGNQYYQMKEQTFQLATPTSLHCIICNKQLTSTKASHIQTHNLSKKHLKQVRQADPLNTYNIAGCLSQPAQKSPNSIPGQDPQANTQGSSNQSSHGRNRSEYKSPDKKFNIDLSNLQNSTQTLGQSQNPLRNDQDDFNKMYMLRNDHDLIASDKDKYIFELKQVFNELKQQHEKQLTEFKNDKNILQEWMESKDSELIRLKSQADGFDVQCLKMELVEVRVRLEERDKELATTKSESGKQLADAKAQLVEVKEQLKEWIDTANKLINSRVDFNQWQKEFQRMSAPNSVIPSLDQSISCSQDECEVPLVQTEQYRGDVKIDDIKCQIKENQQTFQQYEEVQHSSKHAKGIILDNFAINNRQRIDQTIFKKTLAFTYSSRPKLRAQRKRSLKRTIKLSSVQEAKSVDYSENLISKQLSLIKKELITVQDIFAPLAGMHTTTPFEFISKLFCDGIFITDVVFNSHKEFESFFAEHGIHVYVTQRSWRTRKDKIQQDRLNKKPKFIRLRDENAIIDQEFLTKLAGAMNKLRQKAYQIKIIQRKSELCVNSLDEVELKLISNDVAKIIISKLDDTKDFRGCVYSNNYKLAVNQLQQLLGFTKPKNNDSSQSCFQFIKSDGTRIKLYSKDLHLLQATSTTKKVSLGIKPIFASRVLRERLAKCNEICMSRIEHSNKFKSVEDEQAFLLDGNTAAKLDADLCATISAINKSSLIGLVNCKITRHQLWEMFFASVKNTYIFKNQRQVAVVYAYNKEYCKYVGLLEKSSLTGTELAVKFGIGRCSIVDIKSNGSYSKLIKIKQQRALQIPILPGMYDLSILQQIGVDVEALHLTSNLNAFEVSFKQIGDVEQVFTNIPQAEVEIQTAHEIEKQYSDHKGMRKSSAQIDNQTLIHGFRYANNAKLTLYDYNSDIKFQQPYNADQFKMLEVLLDALPTQHQLIQGMHIFVNGISRNQVLVMLEQVDTSHYTYLKNVDEHKKKTTQQEIKRKGEARQRANFQNRIAIEEENNNDSLQNNLVQSVYIDFQDLYNDQYVDFDVLQLNNKRMRDGNRGNSTKREQELAQIFCVIEGSTTTIKFEGVTFNKKSKQPIYYPVRKAKETHNFNILKQGNLYFRVEKK